MAESGHSLRWVWVWVWVWVLALQPLWLSLLCLLFSHLHPQVWPPSSHVGDIIASSSTKCGEETLGVGVCAEWAVASSGGLLRTDKELQEQVLWVCDHVPTH